MPDLTNIEATFLEDLHAQAEVLESGSDGNINPLNSVVAMTAKVVVAMARTGGISIAECQGFRDKIKRPDWKANLAMWVPLSAAIVGIAWKVLSSL